MCVRVCVYDVVKTILQGRKYFNGQEHCYGFKNTSYNKNLIIETKKKCY